GPPLRAAPRADPSVQDYHRAAPDTSAVATGAARARGLPRDPDGLPYAARVVDAAQQVVGDVLAGDRAATAQVAAEGRAVARGQRAVRQPRWPHDRPVEAARAQHVLHPGQVRV